MTLSFFLYYAAFVASIVVDVAVLCFAFSAYRRTQMRAFVFLVCGSTMFIILEVGSRLVMPPPALYPHKYLTFMEFYRAGYCIAIISWGIGMVQLIQYVHQKYVRRTSPNTALEPTATAPSVSDGPDSLKAGERPTLGTGGRGSALDR